MKSLQLTGAQTVQKSLAAGKTKLCDSGSINSGKIAYALLIGVVLWIF
jgi:hypothetical protein